MINLLTNDDLDLLIQEMYGSVAYCKEILEQSKDTDSKYIKEKVTAMDLMNKIQEYHSVLRKLQTMRGK